MKNLFGKLFGRQRDDGTEDYAGLNTSPNEPVPAADDAYSAPGDDGGTFDNTCKSVSVSWSFRIRSDGEIEGDVPDDGFLRRSRIC